MKYNGYRNLRLVWRSVWGSAVALALCLGAVNLSAAGNDNFADAFELMSELGMTNVYSTNLTAEIGEPNHAGLPASASAWFKWTALATELVQFDTFGSDFDTVLAVYTGGSDISKLNLVVANNDPSSATLSGGSLVKFNAQAGQTYYIAVDGYGGANGFINLEWSHFSAGVFRFTTTIDYPFYTCSETDGGVNVTITRLAGAAGRVNVDVWTADGTATNGWDYGAISNTVSFDDWEMSKSVYVPIYYGFGPAFDRTFTVSVAISAQQDGEPDYILPARVDPAGSTATVLILDWDTVPDSFPPAGPISTNQEPSLVNIEMTVNSIPEGSGYGFWVYRIGGDPQNAVKVGYSINSLPIPSNNQADNIFELQAGSDYATPATATNALPGVGSDYEPVTGVLEWGADNFDPIFITLPTLEDDLPEFNEDFRLKLWPIEKAIIGNIGEASMVIVYDDYPAGALDYSHNTDYSIAANPPNNPIPGANSIVNSTVLQADGKCLIAGAFTTYNSVPRSRIARMNVDGSHDSTFNPGSGANGFISSMALDSGKIVIGGEFTSFNGQYRSRVARLNGDGSLDTSFNPGLGANQTVWAVVVQNDGKVLIGGEFTSVNGFNRASIARLNTDGSVDETFNPINALNGTVEAIAVADDGTIYIGGDFTMAGALSRNSIARLNADGSLDTSFEPRTGVNGPVHALAIQLDGRIILGGAFNMVDLRARENVARLNTDGTLDTTFGPGRGANDSVYAITQQDDGRILLGGVFTAINDTRRVGLARLFADGTVDTSFLDTAYNHFAGIPNPPFFTEGDYPQNTKSFIVALAVQEDGNIIIGGSFNKVGGGRMRRDIQPDGDYNFLTWYEITYGTSGAFSRASYRNRENVARVLGGETVGPGNIGFVDSTYSIDENAQYLFVKAVREKGSLGHLEATFSVLPQTPGLGVAETTTDYSYNYINPAFTTAWAGARSLSDGFVGTNNNSQIAGGTNFFYFDGSGADDIYVTIPHRLGIQGARSAVMQFDVPSGSDVFYLGGQNIPLGGALGVLTSAGLRINEVDSLPGVISFSSIAYTVNENGTTAVITLIRTNGSAGQVSVVFATTNGTAISPGNYTGKSSTITFGDGVTNRTISIAIQNNSTVQADDLTVLLSLRSPIGGATIGLGNAVLSIIDDDFPAGRINFSTVASQAGEYEGTARVTVTRSGGSLGILDVLCRTLNDTATAGVHYVGQTNTLHWNSGDTSPRYLDIALLPDGLVTPDLNFNVRLSNPTVAGALGARTNTVVTIVNGDFYGSLKLSSASYYVSETGGYATINVVRTGGSAETLGVNYSTSDGTAVAGGVLPNYGATSGTLVFGPGVVSRSFTVPVLNDGVVNLAPFFFAVSLSGLTPGGASLGSPVTAQVSIADAQSFNQSAGSLDPVFNPGLGFNAEVYALAPQLGGLFVVGGDFTTVNGMPQNRLARLSINGLRDDSFMTGFGGANAAVRALICQSDTRLVVGGQFTTFNGVNRNYMTRLNANGTLDTSFDPGSGADAPVYALAESGLNGARRLYVGGAFNTFNGFASQGLVRLLENGMVDTGFTVAVDGPVYAVAVYATNTINAGKVVIGGAFSTVNDVPRSNIARFNLDGSLDTTFNPGSGANADVRSVVLQSDGKVLLGGAFTDVAGLPLNRVARLNSDGTVDATFEIGLGCNQAVYALAVAPDNRIFVGGDFTQASGVTRQRITRLLPDGKVDPTINFGSGANGFVAALLVQPDGNLVLGGGFTSVQEQSCNRIARIFGGAITGPGQIEFTSPLYVANEDGTNVLITLRRIGGTSGMELDGTGDVALTFRTGDNTALAGINYTAVTQLVSFPVGEVAASLLVPVQQDYQITSDLLATLTLDGAAELLGPQPTALLQIVNVDSTVSFSAATYARNEDAIDGLATITVVRAGSVSGISSVIFNTTTNGTAVAGVNYVPTTNMVVFLPGETVQTVRIPVLYNPAVQGGRTVIMDLSLPVGTVLLDPSQAVLTINDVDQAPGQFVFSASAYAVSEGATNAIITVLRTNGFSGIVAVNYNTIPGTATPGSRYVAANGTLTFVDGQSVRTFAIALIDDNIVQGDQALTVSLSGPTGGATIGGPTSVPLTILDNDVAVNFISSAYAVDETAGVVNLGVQRFNGTNGTVTVNLQTVNGSAMAGTNYIAINRVLTFNQGETLKTVGITVLRDPRVTGNLNFSAFLTNASPGVQLVAPNPATVTIVDNDPGIGLTNSVYSIMEDATNLVVTVVRVNANSGDVSVNYATADQTAVAGHDYVSTSGLLTFLNGETEKTFTIPILDNHFVQSDRTFLINLFNPTVGTQLIEPFSAVATIVDNDSGLRFATELYQVLENGVAATITVLRTGYLNNTNSVVSVGYTTQDGTAIAGVDYTPASGTLAFTNGETAKTFMVGIADNTVLGGDRTVLLKLLSPFGNAELVNPSAATLNISDDDGSLIIPAGTALVSEATNNGVIDPGETMTVLFGFRNSGGTNAVNMSATLLSSNGIVPVTTSRNYGAMLVGAPVKSQPFTFTANGTNGQTIVANFALKDNGTPIGSALFIFTIGSTTVCFTNGAAITITDRGANPAPMGGNPYPSTLNVGGVAGSISKVTLMLTNYSHVSAGDVGALLVGPAGQKTLLMANAGGFNSINGLWLKFDDDAGGSLSQFTAPTSGVYKPTAYAPAPPFPAPAPSSGYSNSLTAFNGSNPNGLWSLFVLDDTSPGAGMISNGWSLAIIRSSAIPANSDLSLGLVATPQPGIVGDQLTYTLWLTNNGPATASAVTVADTLPDGVQFVSVTTASGSATNQSGLVTWSVGSLTNGATASLALVIIPSATESITNAAVAASAVADLFTQNNTATLVSSVNVPSADLVLAMSDSPDPVLAGWPLTYQITITNLGPATATNVVVTNKLPASLGFTSVVSSQGSSGQSAGTVWANLGAINSGGNASVTLVSWAGLVGTVTNAATVSSPIIDPLKGNNTASVKTTVILPQLSAQADGGGITITTPGFSGSVLDSTTSLTPPALWTPLLTNPPTVVNLPITSSNQFFRLRPWP